MSASKLDSYNPYTGEILGSVEVSDPQSLGNYFESSVVAQKSWGRLAMNERIEILRAYAALLLDSEDSFSRLITDEAGKPLRESRTEVKAMANKVEISIEAASVRCASFGKAPGVTRFHPLGVVGVLGPFNFPGHLPNGHIVPALLAGNAVIYKPSEQTPLVAERMVELMHEAGVPKDVLTVVHGGANVGQALVELKGLKGLFFTGSAKAGLAIHRALAGRPQTLLALEMGGNNPLLVDEVADLKAAARIVCQSAFVTSGQRCTCARRLYVPKGEWGDRFVEVLGEEIERITVGNPIGEDQPYLGTVISAQAAEAVIRSESELLEQGALSILPVGAQASHPAALSPGLIDVTPVRELPDEEVFGPLLQLIRYEDVDTAIEQCNATAYGLAAGLISESEALYEKFYREIDAGIINWNTPLTGASSTAPFGGIGLSGNYRPSAYFAADYCAYPTASLERTDLPQARELPGFPIS